MENPSARRGAPSTAGRKRRRAPSAASARAAAGCFAGASFLVVVLHPLAGGSAVLVSAAAAVPYESPSATRGRALSTTKTILPSDSSFSKKRLPSSLSSLAALASPCFAEGGDVPTSDHEEMENDRSESPTFDSKANLEVKDIVDESGDGFTRGDSDNLHAGTTDSLSTTHGEGSQDGDEKEGRMPPSEFVLQLGDFEKEVQMRVSDYQADLKDAMRSVRDRLIVARKRHRRHEQQHHTNQAQAVVDVSKQELQEDSLQHEDLSQPSIINVDDGATSSSSSKQRSRGNAASAADEGWGELVSTRTHVRDRVTTASEASARAQQASAASVETSKAPSFATRAFVKRKKVKVSASGHLHRVHRDLKGGGEGEEARPLSSSDSYVPQVARIASRQLYNAALRVADPHQSLRTHARMLGTALLYAAAAAIMLRMLLWALFMRR